MNGLVEDPLLVAGLGLAPPLNKALAVSHWVQVVAGE